MAKIPRRQCDIGGKLMSLPQDWSPTGLETPERISRTDRRTESIELFWFGPETVSRVLPLSSCLKQSRGVRSLTMTSSIVSGMEPATLF